MDAYEARFEADLTVAVANLDALMPIVDTPFARPSPHEAVDNMAVLTANTPEYHSQWRSYTTNDRLCSYLLNFRPVSGYEVKLENVTDTLTILRQGFDRAANMIAQCLIFLGTVDALERAKTTALNLSRQYWYPNSLTNFTNTQHHDEWNNWLYEHSWAIMHKWCNDYANDSTYFYQVADGLVNKMSDGLTTIVNHFADLVKRGSTAQTMLVQEEGCSTLYGFRSGMSMAVEHNVNTLKKAYKQTMKKSHDFDQQCSLSLESLLRLINTASEASIYHNPNNALYKKPPSISDLFWSPNFGIYRMALAATATGAAVASGWAAYHGARLRRARMPSRYQRTISTNPTPHEQPVFPHPNRF